jgi:hypothetical protein
MIAVGMGDKDMIDFGKADFILAHLGLGTFSAID